MIDITNINDGYLTLTIENRSFRLFSSVVTSSVKEQLDRIYDVLMDTGFEETQIADVLYFMGENSGELYVTLRRFFNTLTVIWEEYHEGNISQLCVFKFNYNKFRKEWKRVWRRIQKEYIRLFDR